MSILNKHQRPTVPFDASNREHRLFFKNFVTTKSWGNCPVKFDLEAEYTDVAAMTQDKMMRFYMQSDNDLVS